MWSELIIKYVLYCVESAKGPSGDDMSGGPTVRRESDFVPETALSDDECKEAISLMKHSADEDTIKKIMKLTFVYRRNMILDPKQSSDVLSDYPRFKDVKGLVNIEHFRQTVNGNCCDTQTTTNN